jgi:hypothetical protein
LATGIRFYLDENLPIAIATQLKRRGIETVTARDLNALGQSDDDHLQQATTMGYVFCTNDADFVEIDTQGIEHAGIVFGQQHKHGIGDWVRHLELIHSVFEREDMWNNVEYL